MSCAFWISFIAVLCPVLLNAVHDSICWVFIFHLSWMLYIQGQYCLLEYHPGVTASQWDIYVGYENESERETVEESARACVCVRSCSLVCLVQNWFKAPGHRKKATLHSRHVPETSSRGSTIAIQQRRLQTPKWVCSVLQCPTWQSATYSAPLAPNIPSPSCCYFHSLL